MRKRSFILLAVVSVSGCAPGWYEASADREVARIVEERKEQTLKYKPQTQVKATKDAEPTTRAYEKIPVTRITPPTTAPLQLPSVQWTPEPLGPLRPPVVDDRLDFVPPSYATAGVSVEPQGPPTPGTQRISLDLMGSVEYAVTHSREYQDQMENLYLTTLDVTLQRHLFEPRPYGKTTFGYSGNQGGRSGDYQSALRVVNTAGIKQQLPYGGEIAAEQLVQVVHALNDTTQDGDTAETSLRASIPLLRGAGLVNLEPLIDSERTLVYGVRSFEQYRRQFAVDIASRFFSLVLRQQAINNRRTNYLNLQVLSERAMALYAASRPGSSFLDVQRAQQNLLNAENALIDSVNQYQNALDNFKVVLGMPLDADLEIVPVELQVNVPDLERARSLGISLLDIHMDRLADIDPVITKLGDAIGQKPKADQLLTQLHQQLAAVAKQVEGQPKVRTLIALDHTARYVVGPRNYLDDILTLAGGTNVAGANAKEYPEIDRETLLQLDPEAIILLLPEAPPQVVESAKSFFATLPQLKAVRTGRVYIHTQWYLLQPTARVRIVAQIIATDLHPLTATTPTTTTVAQ